MVLAANAESGVQNEQFFNEQNLYDSKKKNWIWASIILLLIANVENFQQVSIQALMVLAASNISCAEQKVVN